MIWLIRWITKYTTPSRTAAMSNGKIVDTCAKLPQTHMYMESDYILIVLELGALTHAHLSKIIIIKHHQLIMNKT